jgi:hypothetical protein
LIEDRLNNEVFIIHVKVFLYDPVSEDMCYEDSTSAVCVRLLFIGPVRAWACKCYGAPLMLLSTPYMTMARPSDARFTLSNEFEEIPSTSSSKLISERIISDSESFSNADPDPTSEQEESVDGLGNGMDAAGFSGPKVVKPLTQEALAAFRAAQEKAGVIYISRIPPGMQPAKVRHLMSQYGEVGRVYLQKEGMIVCII